VIIVRGVVRLRPRLSPLQLWRFALLRGLFTALMLVGFGLALYADRMGAPEVWDLLQKLIPFGLVIIAANSVGMGALVCRGPRIRAQLMDLRNRMRRRDQRGDDA
jgi:hypothetical protein